MTLIHTALQSEAQSIIEYFKLTRDNSLDIKVYSNHEILVLISGIGKENTKTSLAKIFKIFTIAKAINIGIAGCSDNTCNIGKIFCVNKQLNDINYMDLKTVDKAQTTNDISTTTLFDMEGSYFQEACLDHLEMKDIYIFKVVSDHLNDTIPSKEFVKQLIKKHIKSIKRWI